MDERREGFPSCALVGSPDDLDLVMDVNVDVGFVNDL